jgi:asparagine synthase (glutamine-hydrolysing)
MAVALEVRVLLLDHVLCETITGIEPARRYSPPRKKLRDAALARLDPTLFDRPKSGFVLPIAEWARRSLQPEIERLLTDAELIGRVGLCAGTVRTLWASYVAGKPGLHWSRVWSIYVFSPGARVTRWRLLHERRVAGHPHCLIEPRMGVGSLWLR